MADTPLTIVGAVLVASTMKRSGDPSVDGGCDVVATALACEKERKGKGNERG